MRGVVLGAALVVHFDAAEPFVERETLGTGVVVGRSGDAPSETIPTTLATAGAR